MKHDHAGHGSPVSHALRRFSTAAVLFHETVAERLGIGPTDLQCFDLLLERGAISASELAATTGLTSGALSGVVARLEAAGFVVRKADPHDGRRQTLHAVPKRLDELMTVFAPLHAELHGVLGSSDAAERRVIVSFLQQITSLLYRHLALLRAPQASPEPPASASRRTPRQRP